MRGGIWVLTTFAAIWGVAGITAAGAPIWLACLPVAISAVLLLWARRQPVGTDNPVEGGHVGRVVGVATAVEGAGIFLVAALLGNWHLQAFLLPAIAIIVGLHFIPLARWIPVRSYYGTGLGLIAIGLAGLLVPAADDRALATGIGAALVLWVSAIVLVRRGRG